MWTILGYSAAIVAAEAMIAFWNVVPGAVLDAAIVLALLNHAVLVGHRRPAALGPALAALALVPLLRLASLSVADPGISDLAATALVWLPLLATVLVGVLAGTWPREAWGTPQEERVRALRPDEGQRLRQSARRARQLVRREQAMIVLASATGMSAPEIARALGWAEAEVGAVIRAFNEQAGASTGADRDPRVARIHELYRRRPAAGGVVISFDEIGPMTLAPEVGVAGTCYLVGAYDVHDDHLRTRLRPTRGAQDILALMQAVRLAYPRERRIYWVQDNQPHHWAQVVLSWAEANNVELLGIPPGASFLKRIDCHLFPIREHVVGDASHRDWEALSRAVDDHVRARNHAEPVGRVRPRPIRERLAGPFGLSRDQGLFALAGIPLGLLAYLVADPDPLEGSAAVASAVALILAAVGEEVVFRGAILGSVTTLLGPWGVAVASLLFASVYLSAGPAYLAFIAVVGVVFSLFVAHSGSLVGVAAAHSLMSLGAFLVYPGVIA